MYIVPMGWLYVAMMMAVAEATNDNGTVLGGLITFVLYGMVPVLLVLYPMGSPARRRGIKAREAADAVLPANVEGATVSTVDSTVSAEPDASRHAAAAAQGDAVAPVRKET